MRGKENGMKEREEEIRLTDVGSLSRRRIGGVLQVEEKRHSKVIEGV